MSNRNAQTALQLQTARLSLRRATAEDTQFLVELRLATMGDYQRAAGIETSAAGELQRVQARFDCAQIICLGGEAIGLLKVVRDALEWQLLQIQLVPRRQGSGIGTRVLCALIDEADASGAVLTLSVLKTNPARRLYERLGFDIEKDSARAYAMRRSCACGRYAP